MSLQSVLLWVVTTNLKAAGCGLRMKQGYRPMACFSSLLVCLNLAAITTSVIYQTVTKLNQKTNYLESKGQGVENISVLM